MTVSVFRGDNKTLRVSIVDASGVAIDTTGWTIKCTGREVDTDTTAVFTKTSATPGEIDGVDIPGGVWDINLLPADTDIACEEIVFDVEGTNPAGKIFTLLKDTLLVTPDVTR